MLNTIGNETKIIMRLDLYISYVGFDLPNGFKLRWQQY